MKFLTLMTPLPMPTSLPKTSLQRSAFRSFLSQRTAYLTSSNSCTINGFHCMIFFVLSNCIACLYPLQDTRNALDDIDTLRLASFLLEEHSNSKYSKHSMIKNCPSTSFIPRLFGRARSPQHEEGDPRCIISGKQS